MPIYCAWCILLRILHIFEDSTGGPYTAMNGEQFFEIHLQVMIEKFGIEATRQVATETLDRSIEMVESLNRIEENEARPQKPHLRLILSDGAIRE